MSAYGRFSSSLMRCLSFVVAMAVLGLASGCGGGVPAQATLDEEGKAKAQSIQDHIQKSLAKRKEADRTATRRKR